MHGVTWKIGEARVGSQTKRKKTEKEHMMNEQNVTQTLTEAKTWIQKHERLLIIVLSLVFVYFSLDKVNSIVSSWDHNKASQAMVVLQEQKAKTDSDLEQAKQMLLSYQAQLAQTVVQNTQLTNIIVKRNADLSKQQAEVPKLQPSELAQLWSQSVAVGVGEVSPTPTGYEVTPKAAIATVQALNAGATAVQNLQDEQAKNVNLQKDVDSGSALIAQGKIAVNGLQLELKDQQKSCDTQLTAVKADARKSKLRWFGLGFVAGYITGKVF
jgi:DNA-binding transcriptional MerR regulator